MGEKERAEEGIRFPIWFEVSVWNCKAELLCYHEDPAGCRTYYDIKAPEEVRDKIAELVEASVYRAGGALNISGIYPLSPELERFLWEKLQEGTMKIVPRTGETKGR